VSYAPSWIENTSAQGHNAAVPHAKQPAIARSIAAFGIGHQGVDFHSLDKQRVHLIFLVLSPPDCSAELAKTLEWIECHLQNETFVQLLEQSGNEEEIRAVFHQADEGRFV